MFQLYISEKGEVLITPAGDRREYPLLGLVREYTRCFQPVFQHARWQKQVPSPQEAWGALGEFTVSVEGNQGFPDDSSAEGYKIVHDRGYTTTTAQIIKAIPKEFANEEGYWLWLEYLAVHGAVNTWLFPKERLGGRPKYLTPKERYLKTSLQLPGCDMWASATMAFFGVLLNRDSLNVDAKKMAGLLMYTYREEVFRFRTRQATIEILVTANDKKKDITHLYRAKGLLPLLWTEILWAIENDKYAAFCNICGSAFHLTKPYKRKAYLCSKKCIKEKKIKNAGGLEVWREKNKIAKRKSRERLESGIRLRKRGFGQ